LPVFGEFLILSAKAEREGRGHAVRRRRARTVAWAVGNGPLTRPRLTSLSANASSRSVRRFGKKWPHSFEQQPEIFKWRLC
jgi:hypothetical protein